MDSCSSEDLKTAVCRFMPNSYSTDVVNVHGTIDQFEAKAYCKISTDEEIDDWKNAFEMKTFCDYNRYNAKAVARFDIMKKYRCNGRGMDGPCRARLDFTIPKVTKRTKQSNECIRAGHRCVINVKYEHNHDIRAEKLCHRSADPSLRAKFLAALMENPSTSAIKMRHEADLAASCSALPEQERKLVLLDNKRNPTPRRVRYWRDRYQKTFGSQTGDGIWDALIGKAQVLERKGNTVRFEADKGVILLLSPVMVRAHGLAASGDIVFVDSTGEADAASSVVTFVVTMSIIGPLPLGVLIHEKKTQKAYEASFNLLKSTLSEIDGGFNNKGCPKYAMTDGDEAERNGFKKVFPDATLLLCSFHVAQAAWRWLCNSNNGIREEDRQELMSSFQSIMYAKGRLDASLAFQEFSSSTCAKTNPNFVEYVTDLWNRRRHAFCHAFRHDMALHGHNTNNLAESTIGIFKDFVLRRVKSYNPVKLLCDIADRMTSYYSGKLLDFARGAIRSQQLLLRHMVESVNSQGSVEKVDSGFMVTSSTDSAKRFYVRESGLCNCPHGHEGRFCKHIASVFVAFPQIIFQNMPQTGPEHRQLAYFLGTGTWVEREFFSMTDDLEEAVPETETRTGSLSDQIPHPDVDHFPAPTVSDANAGQLTSHFEYPPEDNAIQPEPQVEAEDNDEICKELKSAFSSLVDEHGADPGTTPALEKLLNCFNRVKTTGQFLTLVHGTATAFGRHKSGAKIHVQPTFRRIHSTSKSRLAQPKGRPIKKLIKKKKSRAHRLCLAVRDNVKPARKHTRG